MSDTYDPFDFEDDGDGDIEDVTCRQCNMPGLALINTGVQWALFEEGGKRHICKHMLANPGDFEPVAGSSQSPPTPVKTK